MEQQATHQPGPTVQLPPEGSTSTQPTQAHQQPQMDDLLPAIEIIMKSVDGGCVVSPETPMVMAKLCEMLIQDLTIKARHHAEANKRTVLEKCDVNAAAVATADFLVDSKDNVVDGGDVMPPPPPPPSADA